MWIICGWVRLSLPGNGGEYRQERALVMELWHRYTEHKQRMIAERLDQVWVSRDRRATREKIETESKIRKWFLGSHKASQDLARAQILPNIKYHV